MDYTTIYNTYNPTTFRNSFNGQNFNSGNDNQQFKLLPIENLVKDEEITKRINNDLNNFCPVFTFFNDEKIRKLSIEEQKFHKIMLQKWIMLYNSLGFKANVLHYNDAVTNPKMEEFINKKILFNKNHQINENYMKLMAWENKSLALGEKAGFYSDYTIFPMISQSSILNDLKFNCQDFQNFTLLDDYDNFQLMTSNLESISKILDGLINKNKDFEILVTDKYNDIFADYSIKIFSKLMNSKNIKTITERIPKILNQHLRTYRLSNKFKKINIVDPLSLSDHYFFRPIFSIFKTLTHCEDVLIPPPTKTYLKRFEKEIAGRLPDPITPDSGLDYVQKVEKLMDEFFGAQQLTRGKCPKEAPTILITNELKFDTKSLNLISIPHPISVLSALKFNKNHFFKSEDIASIEQNNFLTTLLSGNFKSVEDLKPLIKNKELNHVFFNFESMTPEILRHELSIFLGFDLERIIDSTPVRYGDGSKDLDEIIGEKIIQSQGDLERKLDNVKQLIVKYNEPMPYVINSRQSDSKIQEFKENLKKWNQLEKTTDPSKILESQHFESRHDPIVEISENFNKLDASIWHLVRNVRYVDNIKYKELLSLTS